MSRFRNWAGARIFSPRISDAVSNLFDRAHLPLRSPSQTKMPDESGVTPSWEHSIDPNSLSPNGSNHISPLTPLTSDSTFPANLLSSPPPRSSSESVTRTPSSKWRESIGQTTLERRDTVTTITTNPETTNVVEPSFDESVLRMLCDLDVSSLFRERTDV